MSRLALQCGACGKPLPLVPKLWDIMDAVENGGVGYENFTAEQRAARIEAINETVCPYCDATALPELCIEESPK